MGGCFGCLRFLGGSSRYAVQRAFACKKKTSGSRASPQVWLARALGQADRTCKLQAGAASVVALETTAEFTRQASPAQQDKDAGQRRGSGSGDRRRREGTSRKGWRAFASRGRCRQDRELPEVADHTHQKLMCRGRCPSPLATLEREPLSRGASPSEVRVRLSLITINGSWVSCPRGLHRLSLLQSRVWQPNQERQHKSCI